jgi:hypothetical protein
MSVTTDIAGELRTTMFFCANHVGGDYDPRISNILSGLTNLMDGWNRGELSDAQVLENIRSANKDWGLG